MNEKNQKEVCQLSYPLNIPDNQSHLHKNWMMLF